MCVKCFSSSFVSCSVNGQYTKQGKLGAAVLGSHTTKEVGLKLGHSFEIIGGSFAFSG